MSYYVKSVGKKADVISLIKNAANLDQPLKTFIVDRITAIPDPVPGSTAWPQFDSVFVEASGHYGSNDLVRIEGVAGAPPAPAAEPTVTTAA